MLYRLRPPAIVESHDAPDLETVGTDGLDRLAWAPIESHNFHNDLLPAALRHGVATRTGIVLDDPGPRGRPDSDGAAAESDAAAAPVDADLARHWASLGGDPVD